jgi:osmoprotectant transport system ATP-binding protein
MSPMARALAADPPILLMDEPFGALDPLTRAELQTEFRRIQAQLRKTVILVTHDMHEAMALADRLGVLDQGMLIACDRPDVIASSPDPRIRGLFDTVAHQPPPPDLPAPPGPPGPPGLPAEGGGDRWP